MKITFVLSWHAKASLKGAFKSKAYADLMGDYTSRITAFSPCQVIGTPQEVFRKPDRSVLWVCHTSAQSRLLGSEDLAKELNRAHCSGRSELLILIGPPDGFKQEWVQSLKPDLLWKFGPLTFPHELAAVISAEQIYRAWTLLRKLPYHSGH